MRKKRGISQVITTVLLILLAFAGIAILWFATRSFIQNSLSDTDITSQCLSFEPEILSATSQLNNTDGQFQLIAKVRSLKKINGASYRVYVNNEKINFPNTNVPNAGEILTLNAKVLTDYSQSPNSLELFAVVNNDQLCGITVNKIIVPA